MGREESAQQVLLLSLRFSYNLPFYKRTLGTIVFKTIGLVASANCCSFWLQTSQTFYDHFFLTCAETCKAKEAARAAEAERAAKNAARKDKQWEVGAKDTSSAAEEAAKAAEREARAAAKRAQEAAEGGGAPVVQQKPGLQPTVTTGAWAN